jgi:disulfide oxidoreductase YuzD
VEILYLDASQDAVRTEHLELIDHIEKTGLLYPVTVVDGAPLYDGAVSYPAIMRAVQNKLDAVQA